MFDRGDSAEWNELIVRPRDIDILQLFRIQPIHPLNLRDDLVTQPLHVEPVNKITADTGGEVCADLLHVQAHCRNFVMIENDLRLRLIDLGIEVAKIEDMCLHRL